MCSIKVDPLGRPLVDWSLKWPSQEERVLFTGKGMLIHGGGGDEKGVGGTDQLIYFQARDPVHQVKFEIENTLSINELSNGVI